MGDDQLCGEPVERKEARLGVISLPPCAPLHATIGLPPGPKFRLFTKSNESELSQFRLPPGPHVCPPGQRKPPPPPVLPPPPPVLPLPPPP